MKISVNFSEVFFYQETFEKWQETEGFCSFQALLMLNGNKNRFS